MSLQRDGALIGCHLFFVNIYPICGTIVVMKTYPEMGISEQVLPKIGSNGVAFFKFVPYLVDPFNPIADFPPIRTFIVRLSPLE